MKFLEQIKNNSGDVLGNILYKGRENLRKFQG